MIKKVFFLVILSLFGCVNDNDFDPIETTCEANLQANATFDQVKNLYQGDILQIQEDWIIEGYVVSSDKAGNFFSVLHFQDNPVNATQGFQIELDLFETHLLFEPGQKIAIKTKGLYLGKSREVFKLGGTFAGFGNVAVGRLPALKVPEHIFRSCEGVVQLEPKKIGIPEIDSSLTNTLVTLDSLQFLIDDFGKPFADPQEETERIMEDCSGNLVPLRNSGFSDFQSEIVFEENGNVTGVLLQENDDFFLAIRDLNDIDFSDERCADLRQTSNQFFFSELADPNNNSGARFVELYNASDESINLEGWTIRRYTNANTEISSTIDLSGYAISPQSTFVISPNSEEFELVYGFPPDLGVSTNSPADSNGDDNLELVDPFGVIIDVFGVIGEDGTGTNHEFEDGKAIRKLEVSQGNSVYTFSEWSIFNDSGESGTFNEPQNAPEDFSPGLRI
ncbi:DUF5689 domain-containing protein [Croceivirga thetidis]|uniref:Lamin tail domain-containing protein n=1 Tax=Croceivirga thetidis TaxID=2721623 RepID=A0ABX1GNG5_9FLAO|nr:DUF5689 domain-containing protein [Croceivirga thetidis]NKI31462.1 lamin tail domain-containing protein [Croceivirga thetidis]